MAHLRGKGLPKKVSDTTFQGKFYFIYIEKIMLQSLSCLVAVRLLFSYTFPKMLLNNSFYFYMSMHSSFHRTTTGLHFSRWVGNVVEEVVGDASFKRYIHIIYEILFIFVKSYLMIPLIFYSVVLLCFLYTTGFLSCLRLICFVLPGVPLLSFS